MASRQEPQSDGGSAERLGATRDGAVALPENTVLTSAEAALTTVVLYRNGRIVCMDLNIKDLDNDVGERLRQQAAAAGLSMQQYLRNQLTRIASRPSPAELAPGAHTMSRSDFEAIRAKLRNIDAA